ncbi:MAG: carbohydrate porin [Bradyrhizobium sp.]|nr:carbohydrate porin [Bradyrhizobium sp.]
MIIADLAATGAFAQSDPPKGVAPASSIAGSLPSKGDPFGNRAWLADHGITYGFVHTAEALSNVKGGIKRGTVFDGKLETVIGIDFGKLAGLDGLTMFSNILQLHGDSGPGRNLVGNLNTVSNIEALPTTRLSELWLQQTAGGMASLRAGQLVVDTEFLYSQYFSFFMSSDWPTNPAVNIPGGGAAYPLAAPGIRLKIDPTPQTTFLLSLLNGDPAGPGLNDPELRNRHGLDFRVNDPPFLIGELQYRYNQAPKATELAGGVRLGAWHHFGSFDDLRFDSNGSSLASPLSTGIARRLRGNDGVYAVIDQQLYRPAGGDANSGILLFSRAAYCPPDRSLNDFYFDGGIIFAGLIPARPADAFGASFLYAHMSDRARGLDRDIRLFTGLQVPLRDYELSFEFTYGAAIVPGWTIYPTAHLIFHPGGNAPDVRSPAGPTRNSVVIGARSVMQY